MLWFPVCWLAMIYVAADWIQHCDDPDWLYHVEEDDNK